MGKAGRKAERGDLDLDSLLVRRSDPCSQLQIGVLCARQVNAFLTLENKTKNTDIRSRLEKRDEVKREIKRS